MKPIINPWIIYFINLLSNINILICIITSGVAIVAIILFANYITEIEFYDADSKYIIKIRNNFRKSIVALIIMGFLCVAIPSKETMYTMFFLDNVTEENVQKIGGTSKEIIDYITDQVDKVVNNENNEKGSK